jgi:uncharacterized SAM-binding protein YcdF (DUF218 family)
VILGLALALSCSERWGSWARGCALGIFVVGWILGLTPVADAMLRPLERPYVVAQPDAQIHEGAWVVVLSGGAAWDPTLPPGGWMSGSTLYRVVEGVRLQGLIPGSTLLLMGGSARQEVEGRPEMHADVARLLGADPLRIRFEPGAMNTHQEAIRASDVVPPDHPVFLVTSASHLPRALFLFRGAGIDAVPAPAHAGARSAPGTRRRISLNTFLPSAGAYARVDQALHEYVGLLWGRVRGQGSPR